MNSCKCRVEKYCIQLCLQKSCGCADHNYEEQEKIIVREPCRILECFRIFLKFSVDFYHICSILAVVTQTVVSWCSSSEVEGDIFINHKRSWSREEIASRSADALGGFVFKLHG